MTDHPAPPPRDPDELDQLASDLVDGLLPPEEAARAQHDPTVRQRVEQIQHTRAALRATPPPDPQATESALVAAMEAFDAVHAESIAGREGPLGQDHAAAPPPPVPLRPAASPSGGWSSPAPARRPGSRGRWLAAAAAVLVGLLTIGLLARGDDDRSEDTATVESSDRPTSAAPLAEEADESAGDGGGGGDAGAASPDPGSGQSEDRTETAAPVVPDLGDVGTAGELAARVRTSLAGDLDAPPSVTEEAPTAGDDSTCPGLTAGGDPARGTSTYVADATLDGDPVRVHVYQDGTERRLVATDDSCVDVVDSALDG